MSLRIAHRSTGMRAARRVFKRLQALGENPGELLDAMGQTLAESAVQRLAVSNEGPDGETWPESRRAQFKGGRTQHDQGQAGLAGSITYRALPDAVEIGSPLVYAAQRQFGGTIKAKPGRWLVFDGLDESGQPTTYFAKKVTQPARPYLGISDEDADELGGLAVEFLEDILDDGRARP